MERQLQKKQGGNMLMANVDIRHRHKASLSLLLKRDMTVHIRIDESLRFSVAYAVEEGLGIKGIVAVPCGVVCPVLVSIMQSAV